MSCLTTCAWNASVHGMVFQGNNTTGSINATVRDSVSAGHGSQGIFAVEAGAGTTTVMIDRRAAVNNGIGLFANRGGCHDPDRQLDCEWKYPTRAAG